MDVQGRLAVRGTLRGYRAAASRPLATRHAVPTDGIGPCLARLSRVQAEAARRARAGRRTVLDIVGRPGLVLPPAHTLLSGWATDAVDRATPLLLRNRHLPVLTGGHRCATIDGPEVKRGVHHEVHAAGCAVGGLAVEHCQGSTTPLPTSTPSPAVAPSVSTTASASAPSPPMSSAPGLGT